MLHRQQDQARSLLSRWGWAVVLLLVVLLSARDIAAQAQPLSVQFAGLTAEDWPRAQAVVTVLDSDGRPVPDLTAADFQVQLNRSPVPVVEVTRGVDSSLAVAVVLALDVSGSMEGGALEQAKIAARGFLAELRPQDSVAVLIFHDTADLILPFTQDRAAAAAAIDGLKAGGATTLYQATAESARLAAAAENSRRAVVLLSDGLDNGSALPRADALSTAQTLGVPVFAIGLGEEIDRNYLRELAEVSGGQFAETPSPEGLARLYQEAGELLRGQYILGLDASGVELAEYEPVTLRVDAALGERAGSAERALCLRTVCITLTGLEPGERLEEQRAVVAEVISADPVASVTFLIDGERALSATEPPYQFTFDPASFSKGEHTLAVEVATAAGETETREVSVRTGAAGGGISGSLAVFAVVAVIAIVAVVGAALLFLFLRRRRRAGGVTLGPDVRPQPPSGTTADEGRPPRPLWEEEEPAPALAPQEPLGRLQVTSGPLAGESFPIGSAPVGIGSGHRCVIRLPASDEAEVAAEHARVWIRDGQLMMHELRRLTAVGSATGRWAILTPGDAFSIGSTTFRFELDGEGTADEPAGEDGSSEPVPNILRSAQDREPEPGREWAFGAPAEPAPNILRSAQDRPPESGPESAFGAAAPVVPWMTAGDYAPGAFLPSPGRAAPQPEEAGDQPES